MLSQSARMHFGSQRGNPQRRTTLSEKHRPSLTDGAHPLPRVHRAKATDGSTKTKKHPINSHFLPPPRLWFTFPTVSYVAPHATTRRRTRNNHARWLLKYNAVDKKKLYNTIYRLTNYRQSRPHPQRAVKPNDLPVQHTVVDYALHQMGVLLRTP